MTHRQRIENALAMKPTDRLPYSMWMHFPNRDRHPRRLAELSLRYQKKYDLDFIKFMPYGLYSAVDYGLDLEVFSGFENPPAASRPLIIKSCDWDRIKPISGTEGEFAIVLEAQRLLFSMMDEPVPFIQTVFSPMTTALKLASAETVIRHAKEAPHKLHHALEVITAASVQFAKAAAARGADGLFFASQISCRNLIDQKTHDAFVKKYDLEILNAVKGSAWFNLHHIHGGHGMIEELQDYPVQAINWHDRNDGPSMAEVRKFSKKAFVGGLSHGNSWSRMSDDEVAFEVRDTAAANGGLGVILGPGCVIDPATPESRLELVHRTVLETDQG
jgi:uroporphyrinogen decarboxylase